MAECWSDLILNELKDNNISYENILSQCYDGSTVKKSWKCMCVKVLKIESF